MTRARIDCAILISDSLSNGQLTQAKQQFTNAMLEQGTGAKALLNDIAMIAGHVEALRLAGLIIEDLI